MILFTKESLIRALQEIFSQGWHMSVKATTKTDNDGAVGNTLETLLGINENNLPIPNATDWELKGQRLTSNSLVTLCHRNPSPKGVALVPYIMRNYGWSHKNAGRLYGIDEMSFRSTTFATGYTCRGFRILVDRHLRKLRFIFDASRVDTSDPHIAAWLTSVQQRVGLGPINPEPYWGFPDLEYEMGTKIKNCFYAIAERKIVDRREYFRYVRLYMFSGFDFEKFLYCLENGLIAVDFDGRTGHDHGVKFRIKRYHWEDLYSAVQQVI